MATEDKSQQLKKFLQAHLSMDELRGLCFDLNIDFDEMRGETKTPKIESLIIFLRRRGQLAKLSDWISAYQPIDNGWGKQGVDDLPFHLPPRPENFTGRQAELALLTTHLVPGKQFGVIGPGGMGKTALVLETIYALGLESVQKRFPDGIIFCSFYQQPLVTHALVHIAHSLGVRNRQLNPAHQARLALNNKKVLLLLDGCEVADNLPLLLEISGSVGVLLTSRNPEDISREKQLKLSQMPEDDALLFLQTLAGDYAVGDAAQKICQGVGTLPLALRLVGLYMAEERVSAADYLIWLDESGIEALDLGDHQRDSVSVLLDRAYERLNPDSQTLLSLIGLMALAPFKRVWIEGLIEKDRTLRKSIRDLKRFGFIINSSEALSEGYLVGHALIYFWINARFGENLYELLPQWVDRLDQLIKTTTAVDLKRWDNLHVIRPHIILTVANCGRFDRLGSLNRLLYAIADYLDFQGFWDIKLTLHQYAYDVSKRLESGASCRRHMMAIGSIYLNIGQFKEAIPCLQTTLAFDREGDNKYDLSQSLANLGLAMQNSGEIEVAKSYLLQAVDLFKELDNYLGLIGTYSNLALIYRSLEDIDQAINYHKQGLKLASEKGFPRLLSAHLGNLGMLYSDLGQLEKAKTLCDQALDIALELGDRSAEGMHLCNIGIIYRKQGDFEQAIDLTTKALKISSSIGDKRNELLHHLNLGLAYLKARRPQVAIGYFKRSVEISRELGDLKNEHARLANLGDAYRHSGQFEKAIKHHQMAAEVARSIHDLVSVAKYLGHIGLVYESNGRLSDAIVWYEKGVELLVQLEDNGTLAGTFGRLGNLYLQQEDPLRLKAVEYFKQAISIYREIGDRLGEAIYLGGLGNAYRMLGQAEESVQWLETSVEIINELGDIETRGKMLINLASSYQSLGHLDKMRAAAWHGLNMLAIVNSPILTNVTDIRRNFGLE